MTTNPSSDPADTSDDRANRAADVTSPGDPLTTGEQAPSSGSFGDTTTDTEDSGTSAGNPLAGTGSPEDEPVYPDGSEESMNDV
jgi:hypothetical protein